MKRNSETVQIILKMREQGLFLAKIGAAVGLSRQRIYQICDEHQVSKSSKPQATPTSVSAPTVQATPTSVVPFDASKLSVVKRSSSFSLTEEIGRPGLKRSGGYMQEEFLRDLQGQRGAERIKEMVNNSALIGGALLVLKNTLRQAEWLVEPFSPEAQLITGVMPV